MSRDYGESVRALSKKDWQKAELKVRDAIAKVDQAQSGMEISGGVRIPYMPWFVLGAALQGQGDCDGAVNAWQRSLDNGVVQSSERELQLLQSGMKQCESHLAQAGIPRQVVSDLAENTTDQTPERDDNRVEQERIEEQRRKTLLVQRQEAERRRLESEKLERLSKARRELRAELGLSAVATEELFGDELVIDARVRLVELSKASSTVLDSELEQDISLQLELLQEGLREYRQVAQEWQAEQQAIAYRTPLPELKRIAESYFAGDYESVSQVADPEIFEEPRHKVQAYLFRSAASLNLFWLRGEIDSVLIESASHDIARIKRLDADFQPYVAAFSPRFLAFFDEN